LKRSKLDLKKWIREVFGNVNQEGILLQNKIQELETKDDEGVLDEFGREEMILLLTEQSRNLFKQETVVQQKARKSWLKQGDLNTKKFHSSMKWRRMRNGINGVEVNVQWCEEKEVVMTKVRKFFEARFARESEPVVRLDNVRFTSLSEEDNVSLVGVVSEEEINNVVCSCDGSKGPGPDGFNFSFIKFCWGCLKKDFVSAVNDFMVNGRWPKESNASFICLIPKNDNMQQLNDYRPNLLVGCVYKTVSKIFSIRLKKVISKVIDVRQSTFLERRGLLDSILVANKALEEFKRKKKNCVFFKVDYEKAYDSVRWDLYIIC